MIVDITGYVVRTPGNKSKLTIQHTTRYMCILYGVTFISCKDGKFLLDIIFSTKFGRQIYREGLTNSMKQSAECAKDYFDCKITFLDPVINRNKVKQQLLSF